MGFSGGESADLFLIFLHDFLWLARKEPPPNENFPKRSKGNDVKSLLETPTRWTQNQL